MLLVASFAVTATAASASSAKLSKRLVKARDLAAAGAPRARPATAPEVVIKDGKARVQVRLHQLMESDVEALQSAGLTIESSHAAAALAYGWIDLTRLDDLAAVAAVSTVRPMPRVGVRAGNALNHADPLINGDDARNDFMVDGSGVTVGILSDSFQSGGGLGGSVSGGVCTCAVPGSTCTTVATGMTNQTSMDLPAAVPILDDCTVGAPNCVGLINEGAALGETILDLAPGADLLFHSAFNSPTDFAGGIGELINCGADLIVDDVFWTEQPFFQDGVIAKAAQQAVDGGVHFLSAAGNDSSYGVNDSYTDVDPDTDSTTSPSPGGVDLHDFGGGDTFAAVTIPDNCDLYAELQWSEPFSGALGTGASTDLNLYMLSSATPPTSETPGMGNTIAAGVDQQGCGAVPVNDCADGMCGDPLESVTCGNKPMYPDCPSTVFLAIDRVCGSDVEMRIVNITFDCRITMDFFDGSAATGYDFETGTDIVSGLPVPDGSETPIFTDFQIFGHPAAAGVVAVAAVFYREIDGFSAPGDVDPPSGQIDVEPYSSLGGNLPFYFDSTGGTLGPVTGALAGSSSRPGTADNPPAPEFRFKPDVTGPDGANTTFFGSDLNDTFEPQGDSFPNFFGTSASAPHAAAVAALMEELGNLSPSGLKQVLQQASLDIETTGVDNLSGFGLIDALKSVGTTVPSSVTCFIDDLELQGKPNTGTQTFRACNSLKVGGGDFSDVIGIADQIIFTDGFESGDTSAWGHSSP